MKLDDKRKVIETLLCVAEIGPLSDQPRTLGINIGSRWFTAAHRMRVAVEFEAIDADLDVPSYRSACTEAAYRLIESSPTLVREWFGKERGR